MTRRRLEFLLELASQQRLTTVVAPTGYGKTVLLAQWARSHQGQRIRWVTVGPQHNDRRLLMSAIREALGASGRGEREARSVSSDLPELPPPATVDLALLERLERLPPTTLVIDDFHELTDPALLEEMATLVEHAPRPLRFVIASQVDPPSRFYHLILSDTLVEIRQRDLAFTVEEAAELIERLAGVRLPVRHLERLVGRSEGWAVGLQLAALSLRSGADPEDFVQSFSGDDRGVADYLTEHVLSRLPEHTRDFLLRTSVVDRMSGSLCDALTGRSGSQAALEDLLRRSIFITVQDPGFRWFRYHQLFRTVLRGHLRHAGAELEPALLRAAAIWHIGRGDLEVGLQYLADAGAWQEVVETVSVFGADMLTGGRVSTVASVLSAIPGPVRRDNFPALLLEAAAWTMGGRGTRAVEALDAVEQAGSSSAWQKAVGGLLRSYSALREGRAVDAVTEAERVLRLVDSGVAGSEAPPDVLGLTPSRTEVVSATRAVQGAGLLYEGHLEPARRALELGARSGHPVWQVASLGSLALVEAWSGRLSAAERTGKQALALARRAGMTDLVSPAAYIALAAVAREREDSPTAESWLQQAGLVLAANGDEVASRLVVIEEALLSWAAGRPAGGLTMLRAYRSRFHHPPPDAVLARWISAEARLLLASGEHAGAAHALDLSPLETCEVVGARVQLAVEQRDLQRARMLIERWPEHPEPRAGIERALWLAVVDHRSGRFDLARQRLAVVVEACSAERWLSPFRPQPVVSAARVLYREAPTPFLREACDRPVLTTSSHAVKGMVEQLTDREFMVLPLLPTRMTNVEIAEVLGVSLNTVKTHLKHIYRKLGVTERSEAIAAAEEFHLW